MKIILCSKSPRRRELINKIGMPVIYCEPEVDEKLNEKNPIRYVTQMAYMKALFGFKKYRDGISIGADTIVVLRNKIMGKPRNRADAIRMLTMLSGTRHKVYTGISLIECSTGRTIIDYEETEVKMKKIPKEKIEELSYKHLDKAGAYAIQENGDEFIEYINGDYYNVVGLPINKLKLCLKQLINVF